jgi:hypothetical protein
MYQQAQLSSGDSNIKRSEFVFPYTLNPCVINNLSDIEIDKHKASLKFNWGF